MRLPKTLIISGFPLIGKTYAFHHQNDIGLAIMDSDSSLYSWIYDEDGNKTSERDPDFPNNYIDVLSMFINRTADIIMVSSHASVRQALVDRGIDFIMVYPELSADTRNLWLDKYDHREKNGFSREFLRDNYDSMVKEGIEFANNNDIKMYLLHRGNDNLYDSLEDILCDTFGYDVLFD